MIKEGIFNKSPLALVNYYRLLLRFSDVFIEKTIATATNNYFHFVQKYSIRQNNYFIKVVV